MSTCLIRRSSTMISGNVKRCILIFEMKKLPVCHKDASTWLYDNMFKCVVWITNVINPNIQWVHPEERFYDLHFNVSANARPQKSFIRSLKTDLKHRFGKRNTGNCSH